MKKIVVFLLLGVVLTNVLCIPLEENEQEVETLREIRNVVDDVAEAPDENEEDEAEDDNEGKFKIHLLNQLQIFCQILILSWSKRKKDPSQETKSCRVLQALIKTSITL